MRFSGKALGGNSRGGFFFAWLASSKDVEGGDAPSMRGRSLGCDAIKGARGAPHGSDSTHEQHTIRLLNLARGFCKSLIEYL